MTAKPLPPVTALSAPYWRGTAAGELRVQHCRSCDHRFLYARALCPNCWRTDLEWEKASGRGAIMALTTVHQPPYAAFAEDVPYRIAIVRLEEGAQMMANIVGDRAPDAAIGDAVEVLFEQRGDIAVPQFRLR